MKKIGIIISIIISRSIAKPISKVSKMTKYIGEGNYKNKLNYKSNIMEIDDETRKEIFLIAKKLMNLLKETYDAESVYLCTMCDGPMNHFHIQLIPRYSFEKRGSKNFVKPRFEYREDKEKLKKLREKMQN